MKNKCFQILLLTLIAFIGIWGCKKDGIRGLVDDNGGVPGVVTNVQVENKNGAAVITYTPPSDQDLLYVKAVYSLGNGVEKTAKSSFYTNQLEVEGFNDTDEHKVQLIAVNRNGKESNPVDVTITPLISPLEYAYQNMTLESTAGGIKIKTINKFKGDLVFMVLVDSMTSGKINSLDNLYTSDSLVSSSVRGLPILTRKYGVTIRDRWLNHTDTIWASLTPKEEILLDKTKFKAFTCDNDSKFSYGTTIELMWNGNANLQQWPATNTDIASGVPTTLTWSIGDSPVKLTRFNLYTRNEGGLFFSKGSPRYMEVYGSNNPSKSGDWSEWTKILTCEVTKPSGLPLGQETGTDNAKGNGGFQFDFDEDTPPYKYLRLKCDQNWSGSYFMVVEQIFIWGTN